MIVKSSNRYAAQGFSPIYQHGPRCREKNRKLEKIENGKPKRHPPPIHADDRGEQRCREIETQTPVLCMMLMLREDVAYALPTEAFLGRVHGTGQIVYVMVSHWVLSSKMTDASHLAFRKSPEVSGQCKNMITRRIGALVDQTCGSRSDGDPHQSEGNASVEWSLSHELERPLHRKREDSEHNVDDLQVWEGVNEDIEVAGEDVPEDLGPEEAFNTGTDLNWIQALAIPMPTGPLELHILPAAVMRTKRAQWFLMSFPILIIM